MIDLDHGFIYEDREKIRKRLNISKAKICKVLGKSNSFLRYHDHERLVQSDEITSAILLFWIVDKMGIKETKDILKKINTPEKSDI